jgi:hypothetical protein
MKRVIAMIGLILAIGAAPAAAQQPTPGTDPHHPAASPPASTGSSAGTMSMDMCRQMMMSGPTMGAGDAHQMDPRMMAQMLQMRGEMMRAMGDIMVKHGQKLQGDTK